jgi:hypothetical protein
MRNHIMGPWKNLGGKPLIFVVDHEYVCICTVENCSRLKLIDRHRLPKQDVDPYDNVDQ